MERPSTATSNGSSTTATSTTVGHKRNVSSIRSLSRVQGPTPSSLFLTNLKLLNLDLLSDWPNLSTLSFTAIDTRSRVRSAEWALYQLFRLFDPQITAEKLQPFFPPLEHLQSVNLRAAIYRCLNELKKNGVLGRESTLRKTMLDDCSGEKFWEMCLSFSCVVLRKATLECQPRHVQPIAQRYASASTLEKREKESLLPLAVAHRVALTKVLHTKTRKRESIMRLNGLMSAKEDELLDRVTAIEAQKPVVKSTEHAEDLKIVEQALDRSIIGNTALTDAIVNGDPIRPGDMLLLQSKKEFLAQLDADVQETDTRRDSGVIDDLQQKAKAQRVRVSQWQALYDQLRAHHAASKPEPKSTVATLPDELRFDRHHDLGVDDQQPAPPATNTRIEPTPTYISRYDEVLMTMREELRRVQNQRQADALHRAKPDVPRKPSVTLDAVSGPTNLPSNRSSSRRSVSPTISFRPAFNRRTSSRSRSYQQPRVVSQRGHIPLKTEAMSPIKTTLSGDASPARSESPVVEYGTSTLPAGQVDLLRKRESQSSMDTPTVDSGVGLGVSLTDSPVDATMEAGGTVDSDIADGATSLTASIAQQPSLAERTRLSMAFKRADLPQPSSATDGDRSTALSRKLADSPDTLLARTRQSMSAFSVPLPVRMNSSRTHSAASSISLPKTRNTQVRPAEDITDVDIGASTLSAVAQEQSAYRTITPRERLFDADAQASSIFRSRPKIATSPAQTPSLPPTDVPVHLTLDD